MNLCEKLIAANISLLEQCRSFLEGVPVEVYTDTSQPPFPFSIGAQVRHNLDMYVCLLRDFEEGLINFTDRDRNQIYEVEPDSTSKHIEKIQKALNRFSSEDAERLLRIVVEPEMGAFAEVPMTFAGILGFLYYHTLHHHATIAVLAAGLNHALPDKSFGYNPTTLRYTASLEPTKTAGASVLQGF